MTIKRLQLLLLLLLVVVVVAKLLHLMERKKQISLTKGQVKITANL